PGVNITALSWPSPSPARQSIGARRWRCSLSMRCVASMVRTVPDRERITSEWVVMLLREYFTPLTSSPSVIPVTEKKMLLPRARSSVWKTCSMSAPAARAPWRSSSLRGEVVRGRLADVDDVDGLRPDRQLVHVDDAGRGAVERAALGQRDDRDGVVHAHRGQPRPVDRVDRDVHLRQCPVADPLADVEH